MKIFRRTTRAAIAFAILTPLLAIAQQQATAQPASSEPTGQNDQQRRIGRAGDLAPSSEVRRFVFTLAELDHGKQINSRTMELLAREHETVTLDQGSRIPVVTGSGQSVNWQYLDVGLKVHCEFRMRADKAMDINGNVEMSSVAANPTSSAGPQPIIRQTRMNIDAAIVDNQQTTLATVEDVSSGHTYELSVIAKRPGTRAE